MTVASTTDAPLRGPYGAVESCESFALHRQSTDEQRGVAGAVGQLVQHAGPPVGKLDLDCIREALARRERVVLVPHDDR